MKEYRTELHVHTVLSPCAEIEMIPPLIIQEAIDKNIEILAITDHNATSNVRSVMKAAEKFPITIIPGVEVQTKEEIHFICLFNNLKEMDNFQLFIDQHLPNLKNNPEYFGEQLIVDHTGDFIATESRLLLNSLMISMSDLFFEVENLGGLTIPAHVDRRMAGLLANLVFIPEGTNYEALEISKNISCEKARSDYPGIGSLPLIKSGDAHRLDDILGYNHFRIDHPSLKEIRKALKSNKEYSLTVDDSLLGM